MAAAVVVPPHGNRVSGLPAVGWWRSLATIVVIGMLGAAVLASGPIANPDSTSLSAPYLEVGLHDPAVTFPSVPTNGTLFLAVPRGTTASRAVGGFGYLLPSTVYLQIGDRIVITNHDVTPHLILWAFLAPGETVVRTFTKTGSETYSAGCSVNTTIAGWTTIFVSKK